MVLWTCCHVLVVPTYPSVILPPVTLCHPERANIPFMPDAPQEFASGLDADLRKLAQQARVK